MKLTNVLVLLSAMYLSSVCTVDQFRGQKIGSSYNSAVEGIHASAAISEVEVKEQDVEELHEIEGSIRSITYVYRSMKGAPSCTVHASLLNLYII